jgi:septum formation protein
VTAAPDVILASASQSRARVLAAAGVSCRALPSRVDEDSVKAALRADGATALACAETLAELKAVKVSQAHPDALVIGADQMLDCEGVWFDKPADRDAARRTLAALAGKMHTLPSAVVVARGGVRIWHHLATPRLTMRPLSESFLDAYLNEVGDAVLSSVGAYHLEGRGAQLFAKVEGDFFTILGLSLLPLLAFLREHHVIRT